MIAAAVQAALGEGRPVVALESSVLAQGLPIPANREAERRMRAAILTRGAVPAITAVVRGAITVGLDGPDLERFLLREGVTKVSARDLPVAVAGQSITLTLDDEIDISRGAIISKATAPAEVADQFEATAWGDHLSCYLALLRGVDPTPTPSLQRVRAAMAQETARPT